MPLAQSPAADARFVADATAAGQLPSPPSDPEREEKDLQDFMHQAFTDAVGPAEGGAAAGAAQPPKPAK